MPLTNRVTPFSELVAEPARGLVFGNRGCLVDAHGELARPFAVRRWIACQLEFRGRRRPKPLMAPGRYTELFFLDEVTALAAGHRACAECRRADYNRLLEILEKPPGRAGGARADRIDDRLHAERWAPGGYRRVGDPVPVAGLPDGAFIADAEGAAWLVLGRELLRWTVAGYTERVARPARSRLVLVTPPTLVTLLRASWDPLVPLLHPSATR